MDTEVGKRSQRVTADARIGLSRLKAAVAGGHADAVLDAHGIEMIIVFGSVLDDDRTPADLDLAFAHDGTLDVVRLVEDVHRITAMERVDIVNLEAAGVVTRGEVYRTGRPIFQQSNGLFAEGAADALTRLWDSKWLRRLQLEALANYNPTNDTPSCPGLRPESVQRRLREMQRLLDVLQRHRTVAGADLDADLERRLVIERALQQLVDLAVKVNAHVVVAEGRVPPDDYFATFSSAAKVGLIEADLAARLAPSTGLRNRLVHEYDDIDLDIVAGSVAEAVEGFSAYVNQVAEFLTNRAE